MSKKKGHREEFKQEDILQGVVIADNFANTFTRLNLSTANVSYFLDYFILVTLAWVLTTLFPPTILITLII